MSDARLPERFARRPCDRCQWHHELEAFPVETRVFVLSHDRPLPRTDQIRLHETGRVVSWSEYGGSLSIRVEFSDGGRDNFYPCELEEA